jgi:hypothetical protein
MRKLRWIANSNPDSALFARDGPGKLLRALFHFPGIEEEHAHQKKHGCCNY